MSTTVETTSLPRRLLRVSFSLALALAAGGLMVVIFAWGWDYYATPRVQRPFHPSHDALRPSSFVGLALGIAAAALFVLNLGYLIRKRFVHVRLIGSLRAWMDLHVVTGIAGGGLVAFHAAFAPCSPLGTLAVAALLITLLTGIVGRYIYAHVPRSLKGRELEVGQVREQLESCRDQLEEAGVEARWLHEGTLPEMRSEPLGPLRSLASLAIGDHQRRRDYRQLRRAVMSSPQLRPMARQILPLAQSFCRHWQWVVRYHQWRDLLASWRFLHRWMAVVLLIVASCHIILAIRYAGLWPLKGGL